MFIEDEASVSGSASSDEGSRSTTSDSMKDFIVEDHTETGTDSSMDDDGSSNENDEMDEIPPVLSGGCKYRYARAVSMGDDTALQDEAAVMQSGVKYALRPKKAVQYAAERNPARFTVVAKSSRARGRPRPARVVKPPRLKGGGRKFNKKTLAASEFLFFHPRASVRAVCKSKPGSTCTF